METIAINPNEALNEEKQDKKKFNVNDTTKAAMAAGLGGIAAGFGAKAVVDSIAEEPTNEQTSTEENPGEQSEQVAAQHEETVLDAEPMEDAIAEVDPEEVMLQEAVAEPSEDIDVVVESNPHTGEEDTYRPFAANDRISEDVIVEPVPEEILIAGNPDVDVILQTDPVTATNLIDGTPAVEPDIDIIGEPLDPFADPFADPYANPYAHLDPELQIGEDISNEGPDIQSDLMA